MPDPTTTTPEYSLYGGHPPHVAGCDTSIDAADRIKEHVGKIARKVYNMIAAAGDRGMTVDEIEASSGLKHQTAGPRVREMVLSGILRATENRRLTRSKRYGTVYVVTGDDPRPSVATRADWKAIAEELFGLLNEVSRSALRGTQNMPELRADVANICQKRFEHMHYTVVGEAVPGRTP